MNIMSLKTKKNPPAVKERTTTKEECLWPVASAICCVVFMACGLASIAIHAGAISTVVIFCEEITSRPRTDIIVLSLPQAIKAHRDQLINDAVKAKEEYQVEITRLDKEGAAMRQQLGQVC